MGTPTVTDALHTEDHPAYSRGSDARVAGDVLQLPPVTSWDRFNQATGTKSNGYEGSNADSVAKGVMSGKVKVLNPSR